MPLSSKQSSQNETEVKPAKIPGWQLFLLEMVASTFVALLLQFLSELFSK